MNTRHASVTRRGRPGIGVGLALALLAALLAPLLLATPVAARPHGKGKHCAAQVQEERRGAAKAPKPECFATFAEAIAAATGGRVHLARDAKPADLSDEVLNQGAGGRGASRTVVGVFFDYTYYGGASFTTWMNNSTGCRSGGSFGWSTMPSGWTGRVSSAWAFGGCNGRYYDYTGFKGETVAGTAFYDYDIPNFGRMSNRASSVKWTQV